MCACYEQNNLTHKDIGYSLSGNHGGTCYNNPTWTNDNLLIVCPRATKLGSELAIAKLRLAITNGSTIKLTR